MPLSRIAGPGIDALANSQSHTWVYEMLFRELVARFDKSGLCR